MDKEEVKKLAKLARIELTEEQTEDLTHEFSSILAYVGEVKGAVSTGHQGQSSLNYPLRNTLREDGNAHESGLYKDDLLNLAPENDGKYIKVKKIL